MKEMKKILARLLLAVMIVTTVTSPLNTFAASNKEVAKEALAIENPEGLSVAADYSILMDVDTGSVLYQKSALKKTPSASTSKLITAIAACELLDEDETMKIGSEVNRAAWDASKAGFKKGQKVKLEHLLTGLLLPSGCDAAYILAVKGGRSLAGDEIISQKKAIKKFMAYCNKIAKDIGCANSNFVTPDGYDATNHYTCAYDMALIGKKALAYPMIADIVKKNYAKVKIVSGKTFTWYNTNALLYRNTANYVKDCIGLKTGTTGKAGKCLVAAVTVYDKTYISVVLHDTKSGRFTDSKKLLTYAIDTYLTSSTSDGVE
ncbi:MAG: D-alanyl-D-alanine carboxypeptidase [Lachnospiraceae bacterium]|nr:D-alanyl-D-alanine carboxypeptidase [Lachnospiraceae bacterium]